MSESAANISELMEHSAWVRRLARALVLSAADADDLVQDTWVEVLRNPPRDVRRPRSWLAGVVRHLALRRVRRDVRRERREARRPPPRPPAPADDLVMRAEIQRAVLAAALALDEPYRTTVLQRYFEGRSCSDIARAAGVPASTVRNRLKKALALLRGRLGPSRQVWVALLALAGMASAAPGATTALAAKEAATMTASKLALTIGSLALAGVVVTYAAVDDLAETVTLARTAVTTVDHAPAAAPHPVDDETPVIEVSTPPADEPSAAPDTRPERRRRAALPRRGPALSGPDQIAEALGLTEEQREQMDAIYAWQREQYDALHDTPNADGVTPNEYMEPHNERYEKGFEEQDMRAIQESMQAMGAVWDWKLPGVNETYGEAAARYLREAEAEFRKILTESQLELLADKKHMGSFAVPLRTGDGSKTESVGITVVMPEEK